VRCFHARTPVLEREWDSLPAAATRKAPAASDGGTTGCTRTRRSCGCGSAVRQLAQLDVGVGQIDEAIVDERGIASAAPPARPNFREAVRAIRREGSGFVAETSDRTRTIVASKIWCLFVDCACET
jgi:hypothetical protein